MKKIVLLVTLFLAVPMAILNPLGRAAFIGYYTGVIACWAAYMIAVAFQAREAGQSPSLHASRH